MSRARSGRLVRAVLVALVVALLVHRLGPNLRKRCLERCERMMEAMPESFPPKRMMNELEAIRVQNARILELLEEDRARSTGV